MPEGTVTTAVPETPEVADQIKLLQDQIASQNRRIVELEATRTSGPSQSPAEQTSRRDLLRRAGQVGVAAAGAVGGMALLSQPAAATQGSAILAGTVNTETGTTVLEAPNASVARIFQATTAGTAIVSTALVGTAGFQTDLGLLAENQYGGLAAQFTSNSTSTCAAFQSTGGYGIWSSGTGANGIGVVAEGANGRSHMNFPPAPAAGPPTTNAHSVGDLWLDVQGVVWMCYSAGTPGLFAPLQTGGANVSHFVRVSHTQYFNTGSDGATWKDVDAAKLSVALTPAFNAQAVISISTDLWTATSGLNQDIGVYIEGGAYGTAGAGKIVAWKESGGSAGAFSPNAAFVETSQPLVAGTAYTIKARWKTNKPSGGGTIAAGAGPLPATSPGGGVGSEVSPTRLAVTLILDHPSPTVLGAAMQAPIATGPAPAPLAQAVRLGTKKG